MSLVIVILAGSALLTLGIWILFQSLSNAIPRENYPNIAKISVSRLVSCGIGCPDLNSTDMISNYPKLKEALNQTDAKYFQKIEDNGCNENDCMRDLFFNDTVDFTMSMDRALRLSDDLVKYGAEKGNVCFEGGCHALEFKVNEEAVYRVVVDYRYEVFSSS